MYRLTDLFKISRCDEKSSLLDFYHFKNSLILKKRYNKHNTETVLLIHYFKYKNIT